MLELLGDIVSGFLAVNFKQTSPEQFVGRTLPSKQAYASTD